MLEEHSGYEFYTSVSCRTNCKDIGSLRAVRFCDPNAAQDECASFGMDCKPSDTLVGYHVCKE
jgi:hypothetical protein